MTTRPTAAKKALVKKLAEKKATATSASTKPTTSVPKIKAVAVPVVTLKAVFKQLGEAHGLPRKQTHGLLTDFVVTMTINLKQGDRIVSFR